MPGAIPVSIAELAQDMASTVRVCREIFPDIRVGMDEPIVHYDSQSQWIAAMRELLSDYRKAFGEPMAFVRVENGNYSIHEWLPPFIAAAGFLKQEGVAFGILVTGDTDDTSDADWFRKAEERYVAYESEGRQAAEQMVFQSWMPRPSRILPETSPETHTHFLNDYFRDRTVLAATRQPDRLSGSLTDASGRPIAAARVALAILPGFDDPAMTRRVVKGTVPAGATTALVGRRIGIEGSRPRAARLSLGDIHYAEIFGDPNRHLPVRSGPQRLGVPGHGHGRTEGGGGGSGHALGIAAAPGQTVMLNSKAIPVKPGHEFHLRLQRAR